MDETLNLIVVIVNKGYSNSVMDSARDAGATGGTILSGRGTGGEKAKKFFALSIQEEKELVLILVKAEKRTGIMQAIATAVGLDTPGRGIIFSIPVESSLGLTFVPFEEEIKQDTHEEQ